MSIIATAVKHLIAAGVSGDDLVRAIADMEAQHSEAGSTRTARQERNARYYQRKASEKRLNSDDQDVSDAIRLNQDDDDGLSSPKVSPHTPLPKPLQSIPPSPPKGGSSPAEVETVVAAFSEMARKSGLSVPRAVTASRRRSLMQRIEDHGLSAVLDAVDRIGRSSFCRGTNDRGWRADLDFLCQSKSFVSILEGKYDDRPSHQSQAPPRETEHARYQRECREAVQRKLNGDHGHDEHSGSGPAFDLEPGDYRAH